MRSSVISTLGQMLLGGDEIIKNGMGVTSNTHVQTRISSKTLVGKLDEKELTRT
jgi:hypothetical protein